jgi:hypothetical protein
MIVQDRPDGEPNALIIIWLRPGNTAAYRCSRFATYVVAFPIPAINQAFFASKRKKNLPIEVFTTPA